ncbi:MAG: LURP-one-related family protein [Candidatus Baldrarchaeia archaeon]
MRCPYCGNEISYPNARFCPYCGRSLPGDTAGTVVQSAIQITPGGLLDPRRSFYIIHEKYWDMGWGDIYDEYGRIIGKMERKILSLRGEIRLEELDGRVVGKVVRKIIAIRPTYDLLDPQGGLLARMRRKLLAILRPVLWLEDRNGNKLLKAQGDFLGFNFKIYDVAGRLIAEVNKLDAFKDLFLGGTIFDFSDKYALRIYDPRVSRLLLLGFVIAIDNAVHDVRK